MKHNLKTLNSELSTSTKIFVLFTILVIGFSIIFDAPKTGFIIPALVAVLVVIVVDSLIIVSIKYQTTWKVIYWTVFLIAMSMVLLGFLK